MPRPLRLLLSTLALSLVAVLLIALTFSRLGETPTTAASDTPPSSAPPADDIVVGAAPLEPISLEALDVTLQVDLTRAPLAEVAAQFRNRVAAQPDDHISLSVLASTLLAQARQDADLDLYAEAEAVANRVVELAPTSTDGQLLVVHALAARHEFRAAQDAATAVLELEPDNLGALLALGDAQLALGDTAGATATYEAAATRDRSASTVARLSRAAYLSGQTVMARDLALEALERAADLPLRPSDAAFYFFQLAAVLYDGGDVEGASASLERAISIAPDHPGANELLGRVRAGQGRIDEAIAIYEGLIARGPAADLHGLLSQLLQASGDDAGAELQLDLGLALAAETIDAYPAERRHLATFLVDHDPALALRLAEADLATREDAGAYDTAGWALFAVGRTDEADTMMRIAVADGPRSAHLYYRAGVVAEAVGDTERAVALLDAALTINPDFDVVDAPHARELLAANS